MPTLVETTAFGGEIRQLHLSHNAVYNEPFVPSWRTAAGQDTIGYWPLQFLDDNRTVNLGSPGNHDGQVFGAQHTIVACQSGLCGNSEVELAEQCDDGNVESGDGCASMCQTECASLAIDGRALWHTESSLGGLVGDAGDYTLEAWLKTGPSPRQARLGSGLHADRE